MLHPGSYWIRAIEPLDIPVSDKVTLIYRRFADLSELKAAAEVRYRHIRQVLHSAGWTLPEWFKEGGWARCRRCHCSTLSLRM